MRRLILVSLLLLLIALSATAQNKPNVIYVMADDLGYGDLGVYGQKLIQTPNIDRMAREGLRFTQMYAGSTVCAPSRAVLMTGKHMGYVSVRGNAIRAKINDQALRKGERNDMANVNLKKRDELLSDLLKWMQSVGAPLPTMRTP